MKSVSVAIIFIFLSVTLEGQSIEAPSRTDTVSQTYIPVLALTQDHILEKLNLKTLTHQYKPGIRVNGPSMAHTAFFCKLESRFDKSAKLPLRMRLGDVDYVNRIEGKSNVLVLSQ